MSDFHEQSYRTGVWVGQVLGAASQGCPSMVSTWPEDALPEHLKALEMYAAMYGKVVTIEGRLVTFADRQPPSLTLVK